MKNKLKNYANYQPDELKKIGLVEVRPEYKVPAETLSKLQGKDNKELPDPNTLLIDLKVNDIYETWYDIENSDLADMTLPVASYNKNLVNTLIRTRDDKYQPIEWPKFKKENKLPEELYRHLKCPEANILFQIPQGILDKINTTILVILGIVALFIAWLMMQG